MKTAAILTIKGAAAMTPTGRAAIAQWLQQQAQYLIDHGTEYHTTLRAKYQFAEKE